MARAGSALLYDNRLVHGRGPNRAAHPRYTMSLFCCRSWVSDANIKTTPTKTIGGDLLLLMMIHAVQTNRTTNALFAQRGDARAIDRSAVPSMLFHRGIQLTVALQTF